MWRPSFIRLSQQTTSSLWFSAVVLLMGCNAAPPSFRQGTLPEGGTSNYATIARCSMPACPDSCSQDVVGRPDGKVVDLRSCGTLDVVFTGGTVIAVVGKPDISIIVQPPLAGQTQIEASEDGIDYVIVGFLNAAPPTTPPQCLATVEATVEGSRALVDVAHCNLISNVSFLRLTSQGVGAESVNIDAIEALSFQPR